MYGHPERLTGSVSHEEEAQIFLRVSELGPGKPVQIW